MATFPPRDPGGVYRGADGRWPPSNSGSPASVAAVTRDTGGRGYRRDRARRM